MEVKSSVIDKIPYALHHVAKIMSEHKDIKIIIHGHTDDVGNAYKNLNKIEKEGSGGENSVQIKNLIKHCAKNIKKC